MGNWKTVEDAKYTECRESMGSVNTLNSLHRHMCSANECGRWKWQPCPECDGTGKTEIKDYRIDKIPVRTGVDHYSFEKVKTYIGHKDCPDCKGTGAHQPQERGMCGLINN